jgi:hypothetical protein
MHCGCMCTFDVRMAQVIIVDATAGRVWRRAVGLHLAAPADAARCVCDSVCVRVCVDAR